MFVPDPGPLPHDGKHPSTRAAELQSTFVDAVMDEDPWDLPLLFRVDEEARWPEGLSYRRSCTRLPCHTIDADGRICVHMRDRDLGRG
jgi:hypothetical protein